MSFTEEWIIKMDSMIWSLPLMVLLLGTGIYLTIRMRFVQIFRFRHALEVVSGKYNNPNDPGEL